MSAEAGIQVHGVNEVLVNLNRAMTLQSQAAISGLYDAALRIQADSQRICPVDFNFLRASARTVLFREEKRARISYHTYYAIYVHEDLEAQHNAPTQAKFLEKPMRESQQRTLAIIANYTKNAGGS